MEINRLIRTQIISALQQQRKVVLVYRPRQAGKTTLSKQIIQETGLKTITVNADQLKYVDVMSSRDLSKLKSLSTI